MNPTRREQLLLLEQSGELTDQQRRALDAELAASESARRLRAELRGLAAALPEPPPGPAPDAAATIAARLAAPTPRAARPRPRWIPALAAAAALALLAGLHAHRLAPIDPDSPQVAAVDEDGDWTDPLEAEFAELDDLMLVLSMDLFDYMEL